MIELAVVVAWQVAAVLTRQPLNVGELTVSETAVENMEVAMVRGGNKNNPLAVRGEARLDIHRPTGGQLPGLPGVEVQRPQLDCVFQIGGVNHPMSVG